MSRLRRLIDAANLLLKGPDTDFMLSPEEDYRHDLQEGEHEAIYFLFTSSDGEITGGLRTLFSPHDVLEMIGLRFGDYGWVHQRRVPFTPGSQPRHDASGPAMHFQCQEPWQTWHAHFADTALTESGDAEELTLDLTFQATTPPARFTLVDYQQAQQDGRLSGSIVTPYGEWEGELISYRDHSWGQRGAGDIPGWMILDIPEHLYVMIIGDISRQLFGMGRIGGAGGEMCAAKRPRVTELSPGCWQIADKRAGFPPWTFERLVDAGVSYLGGAGEEAVRKTPGEGDRFKDEIGPAIFTSPEGKQVVGFWDQATRLPSKS